MGIYDEVPGERYGSILEPYRKAASVSMIDLPEGFRFFDSAPIYFCPPSLAARRALIA